MLLYLLIIAAYPIPIAFLAWKSNAPSIVYYFLGLIEICVWITIFTLILVAFLKPHKKSVSELKLERADFKRYLTLAVALAGIVALAALPFSTPQTLEIPKEVIITALIAWAIIISATTITAKKSKAESEMSKAIKELKEEISALRKALEE